MRGITVKTIKENPSEGKLSYDTVDKILGRMANEAKREDNKGKKYFLIIDEINRANMANVFGELIYALEYREREVQTPYEIEGVGGGITIPDNLYIIGTMNTADKSIGGMDYAIRRRFLFFPCMPDRSVIQEQHDKDPDLKNLLGSERSLAVNLFDVVSQLFKMRSYLSDDYYPDDVKLGHTYYLVKVIRENEDKKIKEDSKVKEEFIDNLRSKFVYQIAPILHEYFKDGVLVSKDNPLIWDEDVYKNMDQEKLEGYKKCVKSLFLLINNPPKYRTNKEENKNETQDTKNENYTLNPNEDAGKWFEYFKDVFEYSKLAEDSQT